jgi:type I restriction enzyme S subunit
MISTFEMQPLQNLLDLQIGGLWGDTAGQSEVDVKVMRITELGSNGNSDLSTSATRSLTAKQVASRKLQAGDLLLEKSGGGPKTPVGRVALIPALDEDYICSNFMLLMRPNNSVVLSEYLHQFLTYLHVTGQTIPLQSSSTNIRNISTPDYMQVPVPVPSLVEQKRIVEALDDHLSRLDKALAEAGYAAKATMRFSASLLHSMFTGDLMQRELGIQDINLVELSDVAEIQSGGTPKGLDRLTSDVASESHTIPFYKVGDMNLDSRYMLASRAYLTSADVEKLSLKVIPVGSVIFPKAGGAIATDKKRLVKVPGPIDLNCMAVTPSSQLLPSYLAWWFESFKLSDLSNGSILPQIGKTSVMQVRLPCPSLSEQEQVVHYLEENITQVRAQAQNIDGVAASIETLRRSILNDAFSGKLVNGYSNEQ